MSACKGKATHTHMETGAGGEWRKRGVSVVALIAFLKIMKVLEDRHSCIAEQVANGGSSCGHHTLCVSACKGDQGATMQQPGAMPGAICTEGTLVL